MNTRGYNNRWNNIRKTKALGWLTPNDTIEKAVLRALIFTLYLVEKFNLKPIIHLNKQGNNYVNATPPKKTKTKLEPKAKGTVNRYLEFMEWDAKKKA